MYPLITHTYFPTQIGSNCLTHCPTHPCTHSLRHMSVTHSTSRRLTQLHTRSLAHLISLHLTHLFFIQHLLRLPNSISLSLFSHSRNHLLTSGCFNQLETNSYVFALVTPALTRSVIHCLPHSLIYLLTPLFLRSP